MEEEVYPVPNGSGVAREEEGTMPNREQQPGSPVTPASPGASLGGPVEGQSPLALNQSTQEKGVPVWEKLFRIGGAVVAGATSILAQPPREVSAQDIHQALEASQLKVQTNIQEGGVPSQNLEKHLERSGVSLSQSPSSQGDPLRSYIIHWR